MGQYFLIVNETKKEYINPMNLGGGLKLWELTANREVRILPFLLRQSSSSGGGDIKKHYKYAGRWAGDRIVVVGDYDKSKLYERASKRFKEISKEVIPEFNDFVEDKDLQFDPKLPNKLEKEHLEFVKRMAMEKKSEKLKRVI